MTINNRYMILIRIRNTTRILYLLFYIFVIEQLASIASGGISFNVGLDDATRQAPRRLPPLPVTPDHQAITAAIKVMFVYMYLTSTSTLFFLIAQTIKHAFVLKSCMCSCL